MHRRAVAHRAAGAAWVWRAWLAASLLGVALAGCSSASPGLDSGLADAGLFDSGRTDSGLGDAGQDAGLFDAGQGDAGVRTTVVVHYPAGSAHLSLRGSVAPCTWASGLSMQGGAQDTWSIALEGVSGTLEFKPLLDDVTWSKGANYRVAPGATVHVWPHFVRTQGEWTRRWPSFQSTLLGNTRAVTVYVPPTALENPTARFPVVYMHDGQNLFDPATSFGGVTWGVQQTMDAAAESGAFREAIVVGVDNAGSARIAEYTPTVDSQYGGGNGALYLRMLVEELKPKVDAELPTRTGPDDTVLIGSSLGGLITAWAGVEKAQTFGHVGVMSPSTWWDNRVLLTKVPTTGAVRPVSVYVDSGDGANDGYDDTQKLPPLYRALGYVNGETLKVVVEPGAVHTEAAWARRLPGALTFLLGPRERATP